VSTFECAMGVTVSECTVTKFGVGRDVVRGVHLQLICAGRRYLLSMLR